MIARMPVALTLPDNAWRPIFGKVLRRIILDSAVGLNRRTQTHPPRLRPHLGFGCLGHIGSSALLQSVRTGVDDFIDAAAPTVQIAPCKKPPRYISLRIAVLYTAVYNNRGRRALNNESTDL